MKFDCVNIPIRDHDCVVELTDEFAKFGPDGKDLNYGIVYGSKWILPLDGSRKKQLDASEYVKVLNFELPQNIKEKLYALYAYYDKHQELPSDSEEATQSMKEELLLEEEMEKKAKAPISPFDRDASSQRVDWYEESDIAEDDLI